MTNTEILAHHTDAALLANKLFGEQHGARGLVVEADALLVVPAEDRGVFSALARTITNRTPGYRYSDGLYAASLVYTRGGREAVEARIESDR